MRALLVDDNADIMRLLRTTFSFYDDVRVCAEAGDGAEAIAVWRALRPDVIVMDLAMPVMTGLESARYILAEQPAAQIIVYSAAISPREREQAALIGVATCVDKSQYACLPELARRLGCGAGR